MRRGVALVIAAGLWAGAAPALAVPPDRACTIAALDAQDVLDEGSQPITMKGSGTCVTDAGPAATEFELTGAAAVNSCDARPYIDINGTLKVSIAGRSPYSTTSRIAVQPTPAGETESVAEITARDQHDGVLRVHFDDRAVPREFSRCAGALFHMTTTGGMVSQAQTDTTVCVLEGTPKLHKTPDGWNPPNNDPPLQGGDGRFEIRDDGTNYIQCAWDLGIGPPKFVWDGRYSEPTCLTSQFDGAFSANTSGHYVYGDMNANVYGHTGVITSADGSTSGIIEMIPSDPLRPLNSVGCWPDFQLYGVFASG